MMRCHALIISFPHRIIALSHHHYRHHHHHFHHHHLIIIIIAGIIVIVWVSASKWRVKKFTDMHGLETSTQNNEVSAIVDAVLEFGVRIVAAVGQKPESKRCTEMLRLKVAAMRNSYNMAFTAPWPSSLVDRYSKATKEGCHNAMVLVYLDNAIPDDEALKEGARTGRIHTDMDDDLLFQTLALTDNTRSTEYPVPAAEAEYTKTEAKMKDATSEEKRHARGDTFFRIRREMGEH